MSSVLDLFRPVQVAVMAKVAVTVPPEAVRDALQDHPGCDAVVCSNAVPWGRLPDSIDWRGLFGDGGSPLAHLGGGGLSGKPVLPLVRDWIRKARSVGLTKPIVGCGGVLARQDADQLIDAGADGIELGSVSILRPWRVRGIVRHVNSRLG
jgi:dihydroorotate dehydrogenase